MARARRQRRSPIGAHHAEWLSLVQTNGPFLAVPTLERVLPDGLDAVAHLADLRVAYAEWRGDRRLEQRWVRWVLDELLGLRDATRDATDADPSHRVTEHGVTLRPSYVVRDHSQDGDPVVLLVHRHPHGTPLDRPISGDPWAASPLDRAAELARATEIPLALVTDGERWTVVWARPGQSTGTCAWQADLWLEEPITLRAFTTLLGARRFFALGLEQGLAALLADSAGRQQEVADQLGAQVRHAVELLITTLDRKDRERHGELLADLEDAEVYRGVVTAIMRLVFLFVAEERRLLPLDDPRYAETLAASTLRAQLQERADRDAEDTLEYSTAAWHRVLALFRAVHGGIEHDALRLPAYGGGLFDPDRHPFLEGRLIGSRWREDAADPLPVDDRTMLHLLDALQTLDQGGARVLLSYEALDVEQIGHVYEGLLDHTAVRTTDAALALSGSLEPELALGEVERWAEAGDEELATRLAKATGRSASAIRKALGAELADETRTRLRAVCNGDDALLGRVAPFHALLREDLRGDPLVFLAGSLYVTQALDRRASGTYYTPRSLAEEVVRHTLDPVAYDPGPAQEADPAKWRLKSARELLELKVCDIAMGSGAFLVAACRYLAARLLEAWEQRAIGEAVGLPHEPPPADPIERQALAHRLVAERCLYGVDKNPMAVEMAKLSLWLITLAKDRPFSFVDHALRCGDSLLGITDLRQLRVAHLDPGWHRQASLDLSLGQVEGALVRAGELRERLEASVVLDVADAERKAELLALAEDATEDARLLGDLVVGAALAGLDDADPLAFAEVAGWWRALADPEASEDEAGVARTELRALADGWLVERRRAVADVPEVVWGDRQPFHWALEFREVYAQGGFDAIVGNPPFQGGTLISGALGSNYRRFLADWVAAHHAGGRTDLVAYFYLRAARLLRALGASGLIATNTIGEGDTREVGLGELLEEGLTIFRAIPSMRWPGTASLDVACLWVTRRKWVGARILHGESVRDITSALVVSSRVAGVPQRLTQLRQNSSEGWKPAGMGFILASDAAAQMLSADSKNSEVVRPYLVGEDLNSRPDASPSRWIIDFQNWSEERARGYKMPFEHVARLVKPERARANREAHRRRWWQFGETRMALRKALNGRDRCLGLTRHSKTVLPLFVPTGTVISEAIIVFTYDKEADFGVLSSDFHVSWAIAYSSTLGAATLRYSASDAFQTFVHPQRDERIEVAAAALDRYRADQMRSLQLGLTGLYNRVHDHADRGDSIVRLRELHVALDYAVAAAYGWSDLDVGHGFHETKLGRRFTFAPAARQEVLDRLLELNHERYAEEVRQGLHAKPKAKRRVKAKAADALTLRFDGV